MDEKNVVLVFQRGYDGKYVLADSGGVSRESAHSCRYVGEFKIRGVPEKSKLMDAQELKNYLDGIKRIREEELRSIPKLGEGLRFEIERLNELKEKLTLKS